MCVALGLSSTALLSLLQVAVAVVCSAGLSWECSIPFPFHREFFISTVISCQEKNLSV